MDRLEIFIIIIIMGTIQGFILTALLFGIKKQNQSANKFLALFLLLISITMLGRLLREISFFKMYPNFLALPDAIIFLYGPLMYLYVRKLLVLTRVKKDKLFILFIPAFLFLLSEIPILLDENHYLKILWTKHTTLRFIFIEGFAIAHNMYFLVLQFRLFSKYQKDSDNNFSYKQYPSYLRQLYILIGITLFIWMLSYVSWVFGYYNVLSVIGYRVIWLILPFITYVMGYFAMKNPDFYKITIETKNSSTKKTFPKAEIQNMLEKLNDAMEIKKLYRNPEFSLSVLSSNLSIDRNKLSQIINDEFNKNFNDWTNDYRIIDTKALLLRSDLSIKEIYYKVGFNSKSAFNRAFKKKERKTPTEFRLNN